jgi:hypothetical protein
MHILRKKLVSNLILFGAFSLKRFKNEEHGRPFFFLSFF